MNKAIVSLSFDDGRADNYAVFQDILAPISIPATINITTGYVDGSCDPALMPSCKKAISINDIRQLAQSPLVEIGLHGDCHLNTESDIVKGREKLINWLELPDDYVFGFASPGSGLPVSKFIDGSSELFTKRISYLRTGLRIKKYHGVRVLCRIIGRVIHIPFLYRIAYSDTLMDSCEDRVVYSVPVMKDTTFAQVKALVDLTIQRRCSLTLMFHSILECTEDDDNWSWSRADFLKLCKYLQENVTRRKLDVLTTQSLVQVLQK